MQFKAIESTDIPILKPYLLTQNYRSCDYTVNTIFMWSQYFHYRYAICNDCLVIRGTSHEGVEVFAFPIGRCDTKKTLLDLWDCCQKENQPLRFMTVPLEGLQIIQELFSEIQVTPVRKWFDYVYDIQDLAYLKGNKNSRHRNHVNKFKRFYPNYSFRLIQNQEDIQLVKAFLSEFVSKNNNESETAEYEITQLNRALDDFFNLKFIGAYLVVNDQVVAFTYGDIIKDTLYIHVEKALREIDGSYAMINMLFAESQATKVKYINREDDIDDPGLRFAKESYHPIMMIEKFNIDVIKK